MQPEALEEARDWLTRAQRDLLGSGRALSVEPILADLAVFHAQQAMEKALKAFLAAHDRPFPKTHNLERLVGLCQRIDSTFVGFMDTAHTLNPYVTQFRYPGGPLEPGIEESREAVRLASEVVDFVHQRLFPGTTS
jgi:HEPN domain-containing protein